MAAKHGSNPRQQLALVERLHDVVVGAEKEPGDSVVRLGPVAREEDDRNIVPEPLAEPAADLVAAHFGEVDLEEDERRLKLARGLQSLASVLRLTSFVADPLEEARDLTASSGVAIDDENEAAHV